MNTFYLKLDGDIIKDIIDYEYEGYMEVKLDVTHFPAGINGGWYRWNGTDYVFDQALFDALQPDE